MTDKHHRYTVYQARGMIIIQNDGIRRRGGIVIKAQGREGYTVHLCPASTAFYSH